MQIPDNLIPEDPEEGKVYIVPAGAEVGSAKTIILMQDDMVIGTSQSLIRVPNSTKKYQLNKTVLDRELQTDEHLRFLFMQYNVKSVIFTENFGWRPQEFDSPITLMDKKIRVIDFTRLLSTSSVLFMYEIINLEELKEPL